MSRAKTDLKRKEEEKKSKMKLQEKHKSKTESWKFNKKAKKKIEQPKHHRETKNTIFTESDNYVILHNQSYISSNTEDKNINKTKEDTVHVPHHDNHKSKFIFMIHRTSMMPNFYLIGTDLKVSSFINPVQSSHINFVIYLGDSEK